MIENKKTQAAALREASSIVPADYQPTWDDYRPMTDKELLEYVHKNDRDAQLMFFAHVILFMIVFGLLAFQFAKVL